MANHINQEELRNLSLTQLEARVAKLHANRTSSSDALEAARVALESKQNLSTTFQSHNPDEDEGRQALKQFWADMTEEQFMDAYDHYAATQRDVFKEYLSTALRTRNKCKSQLSRGEFPNCKLDVLVDDQLNMLGLPGLEAVFESVETLTMYDYEATYRDEGDPMVSLKQVVDEFKAGYRPIK